MIAYQQAYQIALGTLGKVNVCTEYQNGYVFERGPSIGQASAWGKRPLAVRKLDGSSTSLVDFLREGAGAEIRSFRV